LLESVLLFRRSDIVFRMPDHTPLPVTAEITKRAARLETKPVSGMSWDTRGVMNDEDDGMVDDNLVGYGR
jgi:hypothetical protein